MKYSRSFDKRTGTTYIYEVLESHYDPAVKQARNTRRLIGKLDPVTGDIVPTRKRKKKEAGEAQDNPAQSEMDLKYKTLYEDSLKTIDEYRKTVKSLNRQIDDLRKSLNSILSIAGSALHSDQ